MDQDFYSKNSPLFRAILDHLVHDYRPQFMIYDCRLEKSEFLVTKYGSTNWIHNNELDDLK